MPRDLADVLHHLIPEAGETRETRPAPEPVTRPAPPDDSRRRARDTRLLALPIGEDDVVRAALAWNLAVEITRLATPTTVVAPDGGDPALWPEAVDSLGTRIVRVSAGDLAELEQAATRARAAARDAGTAHGAAEPGIVLVQVPPRWLCGGGPGSGLLEWTLLLASSDPRDLLEAYGIAKLVSRRQPGARIGVTLHGAHRRGESRRAFAKLAEVASRRLGLELESYGQLVDDLQVYRAVVDRRPIGLVQPQGAATRCLRDVAGQLLEQCEVSARA